MSQAQYRKVYDKNGSGRFVVSEGIAPANYLLPHEALPTLYDDIEDDRFEIVLTKGTIISAQKIANDDTRIVPANGTSSTQTWGDADTVDASSPGATPLDVAGDTDTVTVPAKTVPIGATQYDCRRPFDKGTSYAVGYITHGYVEWPIIAGLNSDVLPNNCVRADHMGRPVKMDLGTDDHWLQVGKVVEVEYFATNFDDGLLSYMQLPSDPGALKDVYELTKSGTYQGKLGIRSNLDVANVVGAMRVQLTI